MDEVHQLLYIEVRLPNGTVEGPMDLARVRERLYAGHYEGREVIRPADGEWGPMAEWPPLRPMLQLKGLEVGAVRVRGGKTGSQAKPPPPQRRPPPAPRPKVDERATRIARSISRKKKKTPSIWPWLAFGAVVLALALYWFGS